MFIKLLLIIFFLHFGIFLGAQDVIVTLTAKNMGTPVKLDSILLENIDNGSFQTLNTLSYDFTSYEINLSKGKIINDVVDLFLKNYGFYLYSNVPGLLRFYSIFPKDENITLTLYDLMGRRMVHHELVSPAGIAIVSYAHGGNPAGIVVVEGGDHLLQTFKVAGGIVDSKPMIYFHETRTGKKNLIQNISRVAYSPGDFVFTSGDRIRFTVYRHSIYPGTLTCQPAHGDSLVIRVSRPCPDIPDVNDFDGNLYTTVQIGSQCWMRENMKTRHYSNGDPLVNGTGVGPIPSDDTVKYWFDYNDDPGISAIYGRLYTWSAVMNGAQGPDFLMIQGICPAGWHIPTDEEWKTLEKYLGMTQYEADKTREWRGIDEGGKLKEPWIEHWVWPNGGATNESGFSALPGGLRSDEGGCYYLQFDGCWWTATPYEYDPNSRWIYYRTLDFYYSSIYRDITFRGSAFSVRCLKN
jgi:uncharacterized protein (TIGR02145 family)